MNKGRSEDIMGMTENEKEVAPVDGKLLWGWRREVEYGIQTLAKQEILTGVKISEGLPLLVRVSLLV